MSALVLSASAVAALLLTPAVSDISRDEVVTFYTGYGSFQAADDRWELLIQGSIYEPESDSPVRTRATDLLSDWLDIERGTPEADYFRQRIRLFLVDNEGGETIPVHIGSESFSAGPSGRHGYFVDRHSLSATAVRNQVGRPDVEGRWLTYRAVTRPGDRRHFTGRVQLIGPTGVSVISDIDDTIKITRVADRWALLRNTFTRKFKAVPGMAELYRNAAEKRVRFHYVSTSPWQLFQPLREFFQREDFPAGSVHLDEFQLTPGNLFQIFRSPGLGKQAVIERILTDFPRRRFVLIGDTGQQDPEIYGELARQHPEQIAGILLRNVTGEAADGPRLRTALRNVPEEDRQLFRKAGELGDPFERLIAPQ